MFKNLRRVAFNYHAVKNMEEYNKLVSTLKTPYVLDFYADWCGPCKMLWPIVSKLEAESNGKWTLIKVDVDSEELSELVEKHQISGVPTLAFYKGAQKIYQKVGFANEAQFKELIDKHFA